MFRFYCPAGHLLEGHESAMGQQAQCPHCGGLFVVPVVTPVAEVQAAAEVDEHAGFLQKYAAKAQGEKPAAQPSTPYALPVAASAAVLVSHAAPPPIAAPPAPSAPPRFGSAADAMRALDVAADASAAEFAAPAVRPGAESPPVVDATSAGAATTLAGTAPPSEPRLFHIPCPKGHELETPEEMLGQHAMCPICETQFELRRQDSVEHQREKAEREARRQERLNRFWLKWSIVAAVVVGAGLLGMIVYMAAS